MPEHNAKGRQACDPTIAWQNAKAAIDECWWHRGPVLVHIWIEGAGQVIDSPILAVHYDAMQLHSPRPALLTDTRGLCCV